MSPCSFETNLGHFKSKSGEKYCTFLEAFADGEEVVEFLLGQVYASLVDEVQDVAEALGGDAAKIEHHGHRLGVFVEPRLFLQEGPREGHYDVETCDYYYTLETACKVTAYKVKSPVKYRASHVDMDFLCSTVCPTLFQSPNKPLQGNFDC